MDSEGSTTTPRYYECVFCKQGFTTAQALGGHMNIHRRERAKNRQQHAHPPAPRPVAGAEPRPDMAAHYHARPPYYGSEVRYPAQTSKPEEDGYAYLGLQIGSKQDEKKEDEVDLELRLGHDP